MPVLPCNDDNEPGAEHRTSPPTIPTKATKLKKLKKLWKSAKKVLPIKRSKRSRDQKSAIPLHSNAEAALQQETTKATNAITTNTNTASTTHSRTAEGKKGKRAFKKLVTRASKIAHKVMDGVHMSCMPRTRRASNSDRQRFHRDEMEGHPVSPTIKAIRAGAPHDRSLAESIDNGDNTNSKVDTNRNGMLKAKLKAMTTTLQWKRPMETIKRASLCLPCLSGSAAVTKA